MQGLLAGEEKASQEGGERLSWATCPPPSPALWGLSRIREREIFSQQLRPVTQARGREGIQGRGEGTGRFPSSSRVMSQQKDWRDQPASGLHLIPSSCGPSPSNPYSEFPSPPPSPKSWAMDPYPTWPADFGKWLPLPFYPKGKSLPTLGFLPSCHYPPLPEGHSVPSHSSASFL